MLEGDYSAVFMYGVVSIPTSASGGADLSEACLPDSWTDGPREGTAEVNLMPCEALILNGSVGTRLNGEMSSLYITDAAGCYLYGDYSYLAYHDSDGVPIGDRQVCFTGNLKDASAFVLPSTAVPDNGYACMFKNCTDLLYGPELPATTGGLYCYREMFSNCKSLIKAPDINIDKIQEYACMNMFEGCTSLTVGPVIKASTLAANGLYRCFYSCTSLVDVTMLAYDGILSECLYE